MISEIKSFDRNPDPLLMNPFHHLSATEFRLADREEERFHFARVNPRDSPFN